MKMKKFARILAATVLLGVTSLVPGAAFAADPAPDAAAPATEEQAQPSGGYGIWDVLYGGNTMTTRLIS